VKSEELRVEGEKAAPSLSLSHQGREKREGSENSKLYRYFSGNQITN
jgi:hypothetical protein